MSEFPDPDEEFELMYGDELELLKENPEDDPEFEYIPARKPPFRRSLNFESTNKSIKTSASTPSAKLSTSSFLHIDKPSASNRTAPEPVAGPSWLDDDFINSIENSTETSKQNHIETRPALLDDGISNNLDTIEGRKRKAQELFGDIDDIDLEEYGLNKKQKSLDEVDVELINKIVASRQEIHEKAQAKRILSDTPTRKGVEKKKDVMSKRVPQWPFISITLGEGERWYLRLHSEEYMENEIKNISAQSKSLGLLSKNFEDLWKQAQELQHKKSLREHEDAFEKRLRALEEDSMDSGCEMMSEDETADLWVERYKPHRYLDLLSDESTNRALLHWLRLWDKVVFNREIKTKAKPKEEAGKGHKKQFKKFEPASAAGGPAEEVDDSGCPKLKVALLCGPPGLGKTTLAHLVARHAGYNVVEMNASDDRSPDAFRQQLEAATQMRSVMGQDPRPNCLVLDEIDGAPAASIEVLLKFLSGKSIAKKGKGKKKAEGGARSVHRPVVCICNDVYVPALRTLRQAAFVLQFPSVSSARLAQRLMEIARKQRIKTDLGTLMALAQKSQNDIRSCVSVLQFFKAQGREVRLIDVQRSNVGQKDLQKGLFTVWQEVFQIHKPKRKVPASLSQEDCQLTPMPDIDIPDAKADLSLAARMQTVLQTVQSFGDYERVAQGVFENYLNMNLRDSRLTGVSQGLEWFCHMDVLSTRMYSTQSFVLMPYLPYAFVAWHFLFATFSWPKISYPKAGYEAKQRQAGSRALLLAAMRGMAPAVRALTHAQPLLQDTLPLLLELTVPSLRPVSAQLLSGRERADLARAVAVMIDYSLSYVQQRSADGAYEFVLDPNIEELALFPGGAGRRPRALSYSCKQLLAHELELERVRRAEARLGPAPAPAPAPQAPQAPAPEPAHEPGGALPNHLQKLTAKPLLPEAPRVAKDFFGRVIRQDPTAPGPAAAASPVDDIVKSPIWFRFKEGYSNAVRRRVKISELQ